MIIYCLALAAVTVYCLMQFHLLYYYKVRHYNGSGNEVEMDTFTENLPFVTIQLPIYNERYVIKRLIGAVAKLDYPRDKMEIHVLDDSTDETSDIVKKEVKRYESKGFNIVHIKRSEREGFKAGALKDGMKQVNGEFIAIFDADFVPQPNFLRQTLAHFSNPNVGVVQTRWEHLNQNYSLLTRVQAFQLNVHFTVEQLGRDAGRLFLQFNGTAGIWRRSAIDDAGGWEADTLTEDLDLSYRAQLRGWEIVYLEDVVSPAELPSEINGLKSQQFRWMKGGAETAKKVLPRVWKSNLSLRTKLHASSHLLASSIFLAVFIIGIFSVPLAFFISPLGINKDYFVIFLTGLMSVLIVYYVANVQVAWRAEPKIKTIFKFMFLFPIFLSLSMGLSFHNSLAVIQGYLGKQSPFIRTPKFNISELTDKFSKKAYLNTNLNKVSIGEGFLFIYFLISLVWGIYMNEYTFLLMHLLLAVGYGLIFFFSVKNWSLKEGKLV